MTIIVNDRIRTSDQRSFILDICEDFSLSSKWKLRLREFAESHPEAEALVWNDVVIRKTAQLRIDPFEVIWPRPEPILLKQANFASKCAINLVTMRRLLKEKKIRSDSDFNGALSIMSQESPNLIQHVPDVFRYTKALTSKAYAVNGELPEPQNVCRTISVIVNYRDRPDLMEDCIKGIARQQVDNQIELLLVNNQSSKDSLANIYQMCDNLLPKHVRVKHIDYNRPFNKSVQDNIAANESTGEVIVFFNNDAELLSDDCLQILANWALEPNIACVGPRILGDRDRMVSNGVFARKAVNGQPAIIRENEVPVFEFGIRPTVGISFACAAISKENFNQIGPLDETVFSSQYNDADFFMRALRMGFGHRQIGNVTCRHEPGASEARTKEKTMLLLAKFGKRFPEIGEYEYIDFDTVKMKRIPQFESLSANKDMRRIKLWRRFRPNLYRIYKFLTNIVQSK